MGVDRLGLKGAIAISMLSARQAYFICNTAAYACFDMETRDRAFAAVSIACYSFDWARPGPEFLCQTLARCLATLAKLH